MLVHKWSIRIELQHVPQSNVIFAVMSGLGKNLSQRPMRPPCTPQVATACRVLRLKSNNSFLEKWIDNFIKNR